MIEEIKHIFVEETFNDMQTIKDELPDGQVKLNNETVEKIFRAMHTIKGSAPIFGYTHLSEIAIPVELVYKRLFDGGLKMDPQIIDRTKDVVALIQEALNMEDDHLPKWEGEKQVLVEFFNNINRLKFE